MVGVIEVVGDEDGHSEGIILGSELGPSDEVTEGINDRLGTLLGDGDIEG